MKLVIVLAAALAATACTSVSFSRKYWDCTTSEEPKCEEKESVGVNGIPFHDSKPYLLVTRSGAKEGGVESKIIYMPDTTTTYYAKPEPVLIGSGQFTLTLVDGRLASFNGQVTADLAGLLADLVSPIKGLADADAARAAGDLDSASAEQIRAAIAKDAGSPGAFVENKNEVRALLSTSSDPCSLTVPTTIPPRNRDLNDDNAKAYLLAILDLACAAKTAPPSTRDMVATTIALLAKVYDRGFPDSPAAESLTLNGKHPTAQAIRAIAISLDKFDISTGDKPTDEEQNIESKVKKAGEALVGIANRIDPQKQDTPKPSHELYEIIMTPDSVGVVTTTLRRVRQDEAPKPKQTGGGAPSGGPAVSGQAGVGAPSPN